MGQAPPPPGGFPSHIAAPGSIGGSVLNASIWHSGAGPLHCSIPAERESRPANP